MGIFSRLFKVGEAKANEAVDDLEASEMGPMLDQAIRDKEGQVKEAKRSVMEFIATSRATKGELDKEREGKKKNNKRAEVAVAGDNMELAEKCLARADEHESRAKALEAAWKQQDASVSNLKTEITNMENEVAEFKRNKDMIVAQSKTASLKKDVYAAKAKMGKDTSADDLMTRMQAKAERAVHEADAAEEMAESFGGGDPLDKEFADLDAKTRSSNMDDRLAKLKAKVGKE